jgi:hypothetical protein
LGLIQLGDDGRLLANACGTSSPLVQRGAAHMSEPLDRVDTTFARVGGAVAPSIRVVGAAQSDLKKHQRWLDNHNSIWSENFKAYERLFNRRGATLACKRAAISALLFVSSACLTLSCRTFQLFAPSFARVVPSAKPPRQAPSRSSEVPGRAPKEARLAKPRRAENQKWAGRTEAFQGDFPQHKLNKLGSLRDAAQAWSPDHLAFRQANAEQKQRANSIISGRTTIAPASARVRRVFVPAFGLCVLILVAAATIRAIDPATPAVAFIPVPRPKEADRLSPSETTKISRLPATSGFTILNASLGKALPAIAQDVPGIIRIATPLPSPARAEGFTILTNLSLPAPLQSFPKTVAEFIAITRPLDQATEPGGESKAAAAAATPWKGTLKPKKKLAAATVSKRTPLWGALPWLTLPNPARW